MGDDGVSSVLAQNLRAIMNSHPMFNTRQSLSKRTKGAVSPRTIGSMLNGSGNPTIGSIEAVAAVYHLEVWELLLPGLDPAKISKTVSESEAKWARQIEAGMRQLGLTEYKLPAKAPR